MIVNTDSFGTPARVQSRMLQQNPRHQRHEQIGMSNSYLMLVLNFTRDALSIFIQRARFDFAADEEVRRRRPALRRAFGHEAADRSGRLDLAAFLFWNAFFRRG